MTLDPYGGVAGRICRKESNLEGGDGVHTAAGDSARRRTTPAGSTTTHGEPSPGAGVLLPRLSGLVGMVGAVDARRRRGARRCGLADAPALGWFIACWPRRWCSRTCTESVIGW